MFGASKGWQVIVTDDPAAERLLRGLTLTGPQEDPEREDERQAAMVLAADVEDVLRSRGFPYPIICDSGNGVYLLYRIDLPNDDQMTAIIKKFYAGLTTLIAGDYGAHIDLGVFNAARIIRVGGTMNRKGDSTKDRPHRRCRYNEPIPECPVTEVAKWT